MGRTVPLTCSHGYIIDFGDFGDDSQPYGGATPCPDCESEPSLSDIANAAYEWCAAEDQWNTDRLGPQWQTAHVRLDAARRELRLACGYEVDTE